MKYRKVIYNNQQNTKGSNKLNEYINKRKNMKKNKQDLTIMGYHRASNRNCNFVKPQMLHILNLNVLKLL